MCIRDRCSEGAGVVTESKSASLSPGDRVFFTSGSHGAGGEEYVGPAESFQRLPGTLSFSQGAGFMMGYTTAYHGLVHRGALKAGEWLLVTGAAGGMGLAAIQLGKALGARVIAAASSDEKLAVCKQHGADAVVKYGEDLLNFKSQVSEITNGEFCDVIYEIVGGDVFDQCVRCVASKGYARLLVIGFAGGRIPSLPANMSLIKGFSLVGVRMGAQMMIQPDLRAEMSRELMRLAADGKLKPHVSGEYPMNRAREAFSQVAERKAIGKVCITFNGAGSKL
eukprot:TRINITY_DN26513_c0_g2_i1.p1 TRINITY_DN26513_c0_g2~~TRINITY_DN26513_c0_g2_i1.p1  ORF type:complete len:280 (-),score=67.55 TRINITY_DN26513_c0_g2_i1:180-1019(-)